MSRGLWGVLQLRKSTSDWGHTLQSSFVRFRAFAIMTPSLTNTHPTGTSDAAKASSAYWQRNSNFIWNDASTLTMANASLIHRSWTESMICSWTWSSYICWLVFANVPKVTWRSTLNISNVVTCPQLLRVTDRPFVVQVLKSPNVTSYALDWYDPRAVWDCWSFYCRRIWILWDNTLLTDLVHHTEHYQMTPQ